MNILQVRNLFTEGFKAEMEIEKIAVFIGFLKNHNISYNAEEYENLRLKYQYYRECKYPYSRMQFWWENNKKE